ESKAKVHRIDIDSIAILKSNFAFFKTADEYFLDDPDIRARIDDVLLPNDNDLTMNHGQQFKRNLAALQKSIINKHSFSANEIDDLLAHIKVKIEKTGARYIRSVFGLLRLLVITCTDQKTVNKIREKYIKEIFSKCKKDFNYSADWIKFFSGYLQFLKSIDFKDRDRETYFQLLGEAIKLMKKRSISDEQILQLIKNDSVLKIIIEKSVVSFRAKAFSPLLKDYNTPFYRFIYEKHEMILFICKVIKPDLKIAFEESDYSFIWLHLAIQKLQNSNQPFDFTPVITSLKKIEKEKEQAQVLYSAGRLAARIIFQKTPERKQFFDLMSSLPYINDEIIGKIVRLYEHEESITTFFKVSEQQKIIIAYKTLILHENADIIYEFFGKLEFLRMLEVIAGYFISLRLNDENDFYRYIISLLFRKESNLISAWGALPPTYKKTGIIISEVLKAIFIQDSNLDDATVFTKLFPMIESIIMPFAGMGDGRKSLKRKDGFSLSPTIVDLDILFSLFDGDTEKQRSFKVTVAPLSMNINKDLDWKDGFQYKDAVTRVMDVKIRHAIDEAIKQKSAFLVLPELCIPRRYLQSYLHLLSGHSIILVGGLEYAIDSNSVAYNSTIISVPISRTNSPGGRQYMAFEQIKNFPSAEESFHLDQAGFKYRHGDTIYVFKSSFWGDFAVLTCSDFLSLGFRWLLQGEVQSIFVPAQNVDSVTYDHISESCIRDLHCMAIVCNNPSTGSSHCYAPYYDKRRREIFKRIGDSEPELHTFIVNPLVFKKTQANALTLHPFRNPDNKNDKNWGEYTEFKQLPPDWKSW
ncbi:MAG: hypothetical protein L6Q37_04695, partial [Bdellovibrionaceae bacterium]|nr:hypothetical protein [Pseudobdellovibrionaceae bacterium]